MNRHQLGLLLVAALALCGQARVGGALDTDATETTTLATTTMISPGSNPPTTTTASPPPTTTTAPKSGATSTTSSAPTSSTTTTPAPSAKPAPRVPNCPQVCSCTKTRVDCSGKQLTSMPKIELKNTNFVEFIFANNSLGSLDFRQFPLATVELIDLSNNRIRAILAPGKKAGELARLHSLDLSENQLDTLAGNFSAWKMPNLDELSLGWNPLEQLEEGTFVAKAHVSNLHLDHLTELKSIDDQALSPLRALRFLNMSQSARHIQHLPSQLFAGNELLEELDLSNNDLIEVPVALRSVGAIERLYLNGNSMTSLRQSDFINRDKTKYLEISHCNRLARIDPNTFSEMPALKTLILSNNEKLSEISMFAFERTSGSAGSLNVGTVLNTLDLSNNNLSTLSSEMPDLKVNYKLRLMNNPWDCTCALKWMLKAPKVFGQQLIHCASPSKFKDMEISQVLPNIDCQPEESLVQRFVLVVFLLFLIVLTAVVFVQRADICRRLHWRDQYGTIYYTKASFPGEQV